MQRPKRPSSQPKPLPFTDEQIRDRAYALWQAQPEQSAEAHWQAAIEALERERSTLWKIERLLRLAFTAETPSAALDVVKVAISAFGVLATILAGVGLYLTYRTGQAQLEAAQQERQLNSERLVTDRFAKAVEQLGSQGIDVRIGAIYSLERIARDSSKDHWTVMEVLTAFVRNKSPLPKDKKQKPNYITADVQSALTVIGRREAKNDLEGKWLTLQNTNLVGADLSYANFIGADLSYANLSDTVLNLANLNNANLSNVVLSGAKLIEANLSKADLSNVVLSGALLDSANLTGAKLYNANFTGANLTSANLEGANLSDANLYNANLSYTNLNYAYLVDADFAAADLVTAYLYNADIEDANLTTTYFIRTTQIKAARNWQKARYNSEFRQQLELSSEEPQ